MMNATVGFAARAPLSMDSLKKAAPSVFATKPSMKMGERYTFIPTVTVVEALTKMGLVPVAASQRNAKDSTTARHLVRFARKEDLGKTRAKGERLVEVVASNSHNGRAAFKLFFGIFEIVCGNGLIVADSELAGMVRRHAGDVKDIMEEAELVLSHTKDVLTRVDAMIKRKLTQPERLAFAGEALAMRYTDPDSGKVVAPVTADALLLPRRDADKDPTLWKTFNVVQENLLRGGLEGKSAHGRLVRTRDVKDVRKVLTYNTGLWSLAASRLAA